MRRTKVDYKEIEQAYVTTGLSFRELGRRFDINYSTLAARARKENWGDKRRAYESSLSRKTYERIADTVSREDAKIRDESILAMRAGIRRFAVDVSTNKVAVSARDAAEMVKTLAQLLSEPDKTEPDDTITVIPVGRPDADFLRRVVEASRGRVDRDSVLEGTASERPEGTLIN